MISAHIQPTQSAVSAEQRGVVFSQSVMLFCEYGSDIRERDRFERGGVWFSVNSLLCFGNVLKGECVRVEQK